MCARGIFVIYANVGALNFVCTILNVRKVLHFQFLAMYAEVNHDNDEDLLPPEPEQKELPPPLRSQILLNKITWGVALVTGAALVSTIIYAWAVALSSGPNRLSPLIPGSESTTLRILNALAQTSAVLLTTLCASTLEVILWATASSPAGITMPSLLSISPSTGIMGLFKLLFWKGKDLHLLWVVKRFQEQFPLG